MLTIHLIHADGSQRSIAAKAGQTLMHAAIDARVHEIAADCGGLLSCATCHVWFDAVQAQRLPAAGEDENSMLDMTAASRLPHSRLSCQVVLDATHDGLAVHLPSHQY